MLDTSRRVTSARQKTRESVEKIPQVLNQMYGLIKRGSRDKTIMVLSLMTMRLLRIHRQKDMISWTWLSSCLKALLAGPGFRFLIFKPQRCSFLGVFFGLASSLLILYFDSCNFRVFAKQCPVLLRLPPDTDGDRKWLLNNLFRCAVSPCL